jgi:acetoin utilization deacetylase AcuC-like enzyme
MITGGWCDTYTAGRSPPVLAYYSDHFVLPLPPEHRFPMAKYRALRDRVSAGLPGVRLTEATAAVDGELALAHEPDYIDRVVNGRLTADEQRAIGFPWSVQMVERSRRSAGATIAACRAALAETVGVNLAGGTHHACRDRGQGYCVFNDGAIAARLMQAEAVRHGRHSLQVAIVDLDVHQGDGTAAIFSRDPTVFTLSLHGERNYPFRKSSSDLDLALPDGTDDAAYLAALETALAELRQRFEPDLLIYLAGADAHEDDRLGKLGLSTAGMQERDRRVFGFAAELGIPVAVTMAGGYGRDIATTVEVHFNTVAAALAHWQCRMPRVAVA